MTNFHKYLRDFLGESEVKFVKIFDGKNFLLQVFFLLAT
jgi:hypothetical protein